MHASVYAYFRTWLKSWTNKTPLGKEFFIAAHVAIKIADTC